MASAASSMLADHPPYHCGDPAKKSCARPEQLSFRCISKKWTSAGRREEVGEILVKTYKVYFCGL